MFQLMTEIEAGGAVSQRELANRLGIAVGLVNSYLKNLVSKGYVRVKVFPRNRYAYLLTPQGFAEKSRMVLHHLNYFTSLYTTARQEYLGLFCQLKSEGVKSVAFCGVDEVAEIAYLSLQESGLELSIVADHDGERRELFGWPVLSLQELVFANTDKIVITSLKRREALCRELSRVGLDADRLNIVGALAQTVTG